MKRHNKTVTMRLIELQHGRRSIEQIMIEAYRQQGSEQDAALALGISQQAFNSWKYRLGLAETFREIQRLIRLPDDSAS